MKAAKRIAINSATTTATSRVPSVRAKLVIIVAPPTMAMKRSTRTIAFGMETPRVQPLKPQPKARAARRSLLPKSASREDGEEDKRSQSLVEPFPDGVNRNARQGGR
jgi:hypothetical protein